MGAKQNQSTLFLFIIVIAVIVVLLTTSYQRTDLGGNFYQVGREQGSELNEQVLDDFSNEETPPPTAETHNTLTSINEYPPLHRLPLSPGVHVGESLFHDRQTSGYE